MGNVGEKEDRPSTEGVRITPAWITQAGRLLSVVFFLERFFFPISFFFFFTFVTHKKWSPHHTATISQSHLAGLKNKSAFDFFFPTFEISNNKKG